METPGMLEIPGVKNTKKNTQRTSYISHGTVDTDSCQVIFWEIYLMAIVRLHKHTDRYSIIDNSAANDPTLSWKAKGIHWYVLTKPDDWDVRLKELERRASDGRDALRSGVNELIQAGYWNRTIERIEGRFETFYDVYEFPELNPEYTVPQTRKPQTRKKNYRDGKPVTAKVHDNRENQARKFTGTEKPERFNRDGKPVSLLMTDPPKTDLLMTDQKENISLSSKNSRKNENQKTRERKNATLQKTLNTNDSSTIQLLTLLIQTLIGTTLAKIQDICNIRQTTLGELYKACYHGTHQFQPDNVVCWLESERPWDSTGHFCQGNGQPYTQVPGLVTWYWEELNDSERERVEQFANREIPTENSDPVLRWNRPRFVLWMQGARELWVKRQQSKECEDKI